MHIGSLLDCCQYKLKFQIQGYFLFVLWMVLLFMIITGDSICIWITITMRMHGCEYNCVWIQLLKVYVTEWNKLTKVVLNNWMPILLSIHIFLSSEGVFISIGLLAGRPMKYIFVENVNNMVVDTTVPISKLQSYNKIRIVLVTKLKQFNENLTQEINGKWI